jgi:uncharacterized membrane protein YphA (DoxX/SURF4 family)
LALANPIYGAFANRVIADWNVRGREIAEHYGFDSDQREKANAFFTAYKQALLNYLASIENDLVLYQRELSRLDIMQSSKGAADVPFESKRLADKQRELATQPNAWLADVRRMERGINAAISKLATEDQKTLGEPPQVENALKRTDRIITWGLIIAGGCLIVGLFTRLAAIACAAFLILVMMSQPPWVPGAVTTMFPYQLAETLALVTLATTAVGRWGGLDFFVHFLITAPFRGQR